MNLLQETIEAIAASGHTPDDIVFIGSEKTGHCCTWDEYQKLADIEYHSGFGAQEVASDLTIVFSDAQQMRRREYDGSEWWEFSRPFTMPPVTKPIKRLVVNAKEIGWCSLEDLNSEEQDDE